MQVGGRTKIQNKAAEKNPLMGPITSYYLNISKAVIYPYDGEKSILVQNRSWDPQNPAHGTKFCSELSWFGIAHHDREQLIQVQICLCIGIKTETPLFGPPRWCHAVIIPLRFFSWLHSAVSETKFSSDVLGDETAFLHAGLESAHLCGYNFQSQSLQGLAPFSKHRNNSPSAPQSRSMDTNFYLWLWFKSFKLWKQRWRWAPYGLWCNNAHMWLKLKCLKRVGSAGTAKVCRLLPAPMSEKKWG